MDIIGKRKIWYLISVVLIVPGILALIFWGLNFGLDFKGGTSIEVRFTEIKPIGQVKDGLKDIDLSNLTLVSTDQNGILIKTGTIDQTKHNQVTEALNKIGENKEISYESVGPTVSNDIRKKAIMAIVFSSLGIILYIAFAFRHVSKPTSSWKFGICAIVALIHDLLFVVGVFAILGHFFHIEIDSLFITALLTIMGFSVHDTIVVFDRIRENLRKHSTLPFAENVNNSILQTLNRSLNTSLTVLIVLSSLYFLGGESLKHFILALLIGITIGTYSSIFNASQLLVSWSASGRRSETSKDVV
jgi:preprotein translocase subunit SecF